MNGPEYTSTGAETEFNALDLKEKLRVFSLSSTPAREQQLSGLISIVQTKANKDTLSILVDNEFQGKLEVAVMKTLETPFEVNGEEINPWSESKGHTIVAIDANGNVRAAVSQPTEGLEEYGDLHPYALTKAVLSLHLTKKHFGQNNDIGMPLNFRYLRKLTETNIFNGSSRLPAVIGDHRFYIGGSGCAVNEKYLSDLLGGATPAHNTQAGRLDAIFCDLVGFYLEDSEQEVTALPEPEELQEIRFNN